MVIKVIARLQYIKNDNGVKTTLFTHCQLNLRQMGNLVLRQHVFNITQQGIPKPNANPVNFLSLIL